MTIGEFADVITGCSTVREAERKFAHYVKEVRCGGTGARLFGTRPDEAVNPTTPSRNRAGDLYRKLITAGASLPDIGENQSSKRVGTVRPIER